MLTSASAFKVWEKLPSNCMRMSRRPCGESSTSRESGGQKTNDLERTGRGGRLHARVGQRVKLADA